MRKENVRGAALAELALSIIPVLITIFGVVYLHIREDLKQGIHSAVYSALNAKNVPLYWNDSSGTYWRWGDPDPSVPLVSTNNSIRDLRANFLNELSNASPISGSLTSLTCDLQIGYLSLVNPASTPLASDGRGHNIFFNVDLDAAWPGTRMPSADPTEYTTLNSLIAQESSAYAAALNGRAVIPEDARVIINPEYHFNGSAAPAPEQIFFNWHAFYPWACVAKKSFIFFSPSVTISGVFVPSRQL